MHVQTDVLVIGAGISGLVAALAAKTSGCSVSVATNGAGTVAISTGCIDLLGCVGQETVTDPWDAMKKLPEEHPYSLLGREKIQTALAGFTEVLARQKMPYASAEDGKNLFLPTILGTMKPSYLVPEALDARPLTKARTILVCGVEGLRDLSPKLCRDQLKRQAALAQTRITAAMLPSPFPHTHRGITALDLARHVNTDEGLTWLETSLGRFAKAFDVVLLPPILGTSRNAELLTHFKELLSAHVEEMLSIPPGVGGIRLREALSREATQQGVRFLENVNIQKAQCQSGHCVSVETDGIDPLRITAKSFVLATGGILGGGIRTTPFEAVEPLFHLEISPALEKVRNEPDVRKAKDLLTSLGVTVGHDLRPKDAAGACFLDNVFLAGRILGGYDFAREKSGHGVAIATGWTAGTLAADLFGRETKS